MNIIFYNVNTLTKSLNNKHSISCVVIFLFKIWKLLWIWYWMILHQKCYWKIKMKILIFFIHWFFFIQVSNCDDSTYTKKINTWICSIWIDIFGGKDQENQNISIYSSKIELEIEAIQLGTHGRFSRIWFPKRAIAKLTKRSDGSRIFDLFVDWNDRTSNICWHFDRSKSCIFLCSFRWDRSV